jgi:predicted enzyme related to lactoylglutathione lyase
MAEFTSYAHGTPCWVDVTSTDLDRTTSFYGDLFGWEAETSPEPEAGGYTMFTLRGKNVAAASPPPPGSPQTSSWTTSTTRPRRSATPAAPSSWSRSTSSTPAG